MAKMGRKPVDGVVRETVISFKISKDEFERLSKLAESLEIPKTVLLRNLFLDALDDAEALNRIGAFKIVKGIKKTSEFLEKLKTIKESESIKNN